MASDRRSPQRRPAAFIHDFVDVNHPLATVRDRFEDGGAWLQPLATAASGDGESLLVRIGPPGAGRVGPDVVIQLGAPMAHDDGIVLPLRWEAARLRPLFPVLDGDLELAPLGPDRCRLVLQASYRVPFDGIGQFLDHALLHRVAESTIRSFLGRVAESLEREV